MLCSRRSLKRRFFPEERHLVVPLATELILYYAYYHPEERHLVVPLATELILYYAYYSNGKNKRDG